MIPKPTNMGHIILGFVTYYVLAEKFPNYTFLCVIAGVIVAFSH